MLRVGWRGMQQGGGKMEDMITLASLDKRLRKLWKRVVKAQGLGPDAAGCKLTFDGVEVGKKDTLLMLDATLREEAASRAEKSSVAASTAADCWVTAHIGVPAAQ